MDVEQDRGLVLVRLDECYDAFAEMQLHEAEEKLARLAEIMEADWLLLDFSRTHYFGSLFLETMIRVWNKLKRRRKQFALCGLKQHAAEVLRITRLDTVWKVFPDEMTARTQLNET